MKNRVLYFGKVIGFICLTSLFILAGCSNNNNNNNNSSLENTAEKQSIPVKTLTIEPQSFVEYAEYYGEVTGIKEAMLINVTGGRVESVHVKEGDRVKAGTSLGKIDSASAQNTYDTAVLNEKIAKEEYYRNKKFLTSGNSSEIKVDQAHLAWLVARKNLLDAKRLYEGAFCITPITGTVVSRYIDVHQECAPGTPTFTVAELSMLKVSIGVAENDIKDINVGDEAEIRFSAYPDKTWHGTISRVGRKVSPGLITFPVEVHMENPSDLILSGLVAHVKIFKARLNEKIVVPIQSVLTEGSEHYVMVVDDESASKRVVKVDYTNKTQMLIEEGLVFGDELIVEGNHIVDDGIPVRVIN